MAADCLAERSVEADLGLCKLPEMPDFVVDAIMDDMAGRFRPCAIPTDAAIA